ncbi:hypothetical protein GQ600_12456 [Phytophthora cactorum]|nr:hypothetical protein GQ600_12456 [Phytophthora cactorum]
MRQPCGVLLLVTALLIYGVGAHTNLQSSTRLIATGWRDIATSRLLKAHRITTDELLTTNTDDEERVGVTMSAVEMLRNALKSSVPESQLEIWFKHAASADDVFKFLLLDDAADDLLRAWISYMKRFNTANLPKKTSLIATLTAHYGDEGMAKIIEGAKQVSSTASIAKRLESELMQLWLGQKHSVDDVFKLLKLDEAGDQLFAQPQVVAWAKYVDEFNELHPDKQVSLFSALTARYPNEETLVKMLIATKKSPSVENIAVRVQSEQTKLWQANKKSRPTLTADKTSRTQNFAKRLRSELLREWYDTLKPGDFVFKALKLDKTGSKVFERSLFALWKEYMEFVSLKDPRIKVNMLTPLIKVYGERKLVKILTTAENVPSTKTIATNLQEALLNRWLDDKKKPEAGKHLPYVRGIGVIAVHTDNDELMKQIEERKRIKRELQKNAGNRGDLQDDNDQDDGELVEDNGDDDLFDFDDGEATDEGQALVENEVVRGLKKPRGPAVVPASITMVEVRDW